eukprot:m.158669 g.158669  ORF g.158669 m.158669 type:complete len:288 (+) comp14506_c0_seq22:89-952(+)
MPATSIVPAEVERWRRLASLVGTALLVQKTVPAAWVNLIFGRIVTEPLGPLIPSSMLATCTCLSSASMLTFAALNGDGMKHPFVRKVLASAGFGHRDASNWMKTMVRHSRYDRACAELHPGQPSCTKALIVGLPEVIRVAVRDILYLYGLLLARSVAVGAPRPPIRPFGRTFAFCVLSFSTIRVLSCTACAASIRVPLLNNWLFINTLFPLWFSLSMLWLKIESTARQRQVTMFAMSAGTSALLQKVGLWPADTVIQAIVTAWLHPAVSDASKAGLKALVKAIRSSK